MYTAVVDTFRKDNSQPVECNIEGAVPTWLNGSLYRNGPGLFHVGDDSYTHLFDGLAVLQKYSFADGRVSYQNRILQSEAYKRNTAANRIVVGEFGTLGFPDPCRSIFTRYFAYYFGTPNTDNDSVNIVMMRDQMYAMTETPRLNRINLDTLETDAQVDLQNYIAVHTATAHPLQDRDGTTWNMGSAFGRHSKYCVIKMPPASPDVAEAISTAELVCRIDSKWALEPSYYHSYGMSENYVVLVEQPLTLPLHALATAKLRGIPFSDLVRYYPNEKCRFLVVDKRTGKLSSTRYVSDSFFTFHHVNTYEDSGHLVVDLCAYSNGDVVRNFKVEEMRKRKGFASDLPEFRRYVLPLYIDEKCSSDNLVQLSYTSASAGVLDDGSVFLTPECFPDCLMDLPRVNPAVNLCKYRYAYGISYSNSEGGQLVKLDIETHTVLRWSVAQCYAGEPVFIARPGATQEDDGVILSPVLYFDDDRPSFLLILDAATFKEIGRAVVPDGVKIPQTFHGIFVP